MDPAVKRVTGAHRPHSHGPERLRVVVSGTELLRGGRALAPTLMGRT